MELVERATRDTQVLDHAKAITALREVMNTITTPTVD